MMLSVVVIFYDMVREAPRTLQSLSPAYQQAVHDSYEVIAIDNGSDHRLDADEVQGLGPQFKYHFHDTASASPVAAINLGAEMASGELLAVIVDGARMSTPALIGQTQRAATLFERPFVTALSWHLGPAVQNESMLTGYDQIEEDRLLEKINWPSDGYDLFSISTLAQSSEPGFLRGVPVECSWWTMRRNDFVEVGGFDERFTSPGGGLVNHDFRNRVLALDGISPVVLLGEGVFHQFHGGVATNVKREDHPIARFRAEYEAIRGVPYQPVASSPTHYFGTMPESARRFVG